MPNWNSNVVTFRHENTEQIKKLIEATESENLFNTFVSRPIDQEDNWYDWNVNNWGTKWECDSAEQISRDDNSVKLAFLTAWSPPIEFYTAMEELGFEVEAFYYEPGMGFCGQYYMGSDQFFEIRGDSYWIEDNIPEEINKAFEISENVREYEEEFAEVTGE